MQQKQRLSIDKHHAVQPTPHIIFGTSRTVAHSPRTAKQRMRQTCMQKEHPLNSTFHARVLQLSCRGFDGATRRLLQRTCKLGAHNSAGLLQTCVHTHASNTIKQDEMLPLGKQFNSNKPALHAHKTNHKGKRQPTAQTKKYCNKHSIGTEEEEEHEHGAGTKSVRS